MYQILLVPNISQYTCAAFRYQSVYCSLHSVLCRNAGSYLWFYGFHLIENSCFILMATRLLHRAVSRLLRSRAPTARPQRTVQLVAHQDSHAQCFSTHRISFSAQTVVYAPLLPRHRRLATRATAKEVSPSLEDDEEDLGSDIEDFDEDFTEESVGRQIVVGDAVWCGFIVSCLSCE